MQGVRVIFVYVLTLGILAGLYRYQQRDPSGPIPVVEFLADRISYSERGFSRSGFDSVVSNKYWESVLQSEFEGAQREVASTGTALNSITPLSLPDKLGLKNGDTVTEPWTRNDNIYRLRIRRGRFNVQLTLKVLN